MDERSQSVPIEAANQTSTINRPDFKHEPLAATEIRVVEILPGLSDDRLLQCTVRRIVLANTHAALSYTCGTSNDMKTIVVNGGHFQVRPNLWHFLNTARATGSHRDKDLWIDALSIDQGNIPERNAQVRSMAEIYSQAADVSVWLGQGDENIEAALNALRRLQAHIEIHGIRRPDLPHEQKGLPPSPNFRALLQLCNLPYWKRMWIIQEMMLSSVIWIFYGRSFCEWRYLFRHMFYDDGLAGIRLKAKGESLAYRLLNSRGFNIYERPRDQTTSLARPLSDLLADFETFECSDFHDHIFAILSMAEHRRAFHIDYRDTKIQLLGKVLQFCERYEGATHLVTIAITLRKILGIEKDELQSWRLNDKAKISPNDNLASFRYGLRFLPFAVFGGVGFDVVDVKNFLTSSQKDFQAQPSEGDRMIKICWSEKFEKDWLDQGSRIQVEDWLRCPFLKDEWLVPGWRDSDNWETLDLSIRPSTLIRPGDILLLEPDLRLWLLARSFQQDPPVTIVARVRFDEESETLHGDFLDAYPFSKPGNYQTLDFASFLEFISVVEIKHKLWELNKRGRNRTQDHKWMAEQNMGEMNLRSKHSKHSRMEPPGSINLETMWALDHDVCAYCNFDQLEPLAQQFRAAISAGQSQT